MNTKYGDNEKKVTDNIEQLIPKQMYYNSLDTSVRNLSVAVHESLQKKQRQKFLFRKKVLQIIPIASIATVALLYFTFFYDNVSNLEHANHGVIQDFESLSSQHSTAEFNAIIDEELNSEHYDFIYQDDALFLFDDMTSSDLQTTVEDLIAIL